MVNKSTHTYNYRICFVYYTSFLNFNATSPMNNARSELEELQYNCKLKAMNVKAAMETALNDEFNDDWIINNYMSCVKESEQSIKMLIEYKGARL